MFYGILLGMNIDAAILPETPGNLKEIISGLHGQIALLHETHDKETGILLEQIRHLRAQLFGRKSEKIQGGPQTLPLFDMPEPVKKRKKRFIFLPTTARNVAESPFRKTFPGLNVFMTLMMRTKYAHVAVN
jgi:transposase IS166 family protein